MSKRIIAFVCLVQVSAIASFYALASLTPGFDTTLLGGAACFALLAGVASYFTYAVMDGKTRASASLAPILAAIAIYPAWPTALLLVATLTLAETRRKNMEWIKRIFNVGQAMVALSTAIITYLLLDGVSLQIDQKLRLLPEAGSTVAFILVNNIAVTGVFSIAENRPFFSNLFSAMKGSVLNYAMAVPWIHAFAMVYVHFGYVGAGFLAFILFGLRQLSSATIKLQRYNDELLTVLVNSVDMRDPYTSGHSQRVAKSSEIIAAKVLRLSKRQVERIRIAAMLHDVGKIHEIFTVLLRKNGPLTPEERSVMELHPIKSVEYVQGVADLEDVLPSIRHHHERWDGAGYPDKIAGKDIPLGARIITFADTIDAMTTDRPYRPAMTEADVRAELVKQRGKQFDPEICDALINSPYYSLLFQKDASLTAELSTPSLLRLPRPKLEAQPAAPTDASAPAPAARIAS